MPLLRRRSHVVGSLWHCLIAFVTVTFSTVIAEPTPGWWQMSYYHQGQWRHLKNWNENSVDDYVVANVGQLKNFATSAASQMKTVLSNYGKEGPEIAAMIEDWKTPSSLEDDYSALTAGQAKAVAVKFYERLASIYAWPANSQPWPASPTQETDDFEIINIGQLKSLFSFDILNPDGDFDNDGILNGFEIRYGLDFRVANASEDSDGDGLSNLHEYWLGLNPLLADSNGNGIDDGDEDTDLDGVSNWDEILAGADPADSLNGVYANLINQNYQSSHQLILQGKLAPDPVQLKVTRYNSETSQSDPVPNIPVLFEIQEGQGTLVHINGEENSSRLAAHTNEEGIVTMQFRGHSTKQTTKVRASIVRPKPGLTYPSPVNFIMWTSQCATDTDDDGMDDIWEDAIVTASQGALPDITWVKPEDDFDGDGYPNIFEFERGTDPTSPLSYPTADVVLDHAGANHGILPVAHSWNEAITNFALAGGSAEHPETRTIIQVMPGTWTTGNQSITRSVLISGRGDANTGLPVLVPQGEGNNVVSVDYTMKYRGVFMMQGIALDGLGLRDVRGMWISYLFDQIISKPLSKIENCIIRRCEFSAMDYNNFNINLSFSTILNCGDNSGYGAPGLRLYKSHLESTACLLYNPNATEEIGAYGGSTWTQNKSMIGFNSGIDASGKLQPGEHNRGLHVVGIGMPPQVDIDGEYRHPLMLLAGADQLLDSDGDGLDDLEEISLGTDGFLVDSDGDGVGDDVDAFPLDPFLQSLTSEGPEPVITLISPSTAQEIQ